MKSFDTYAKKLDSIVTKLPTYGQYHKIIKEAWEREGKSLYASDIFTDFTRELKNILKYLEAGDVKDYRWHGYVAAVIFKPTKSPYFRLGLFGKCENVPVNGDLEAVIAIGFDELGDYEDGERPELVVYYLNRNFRNDNPFSHTDIDLYKPEDWKNTLNEFFDMSKVR
ncbi:hypothetical protein DRN75_00510 [Nanoarchaeota archaeon]|nr:MAG: hypothetical protein DRN75_00510 [Nanoarchaeota archaeon]